MREDQEEEIVCRCEDVSLKELLEAIDRGYTTLDQLKRYLRIGMGHCQGRTCLRLAAGVLARKLGKRVNEIEWPTVRPPILPVEISKLAEVDERDKR
ncbi:MAG TPA: (2Fe-2S)-binding protein [Candidatus Korarchaeota archaeon]|nr:(2Fe-2S)-binding protein [Candidatus Korarchaeota archaeon]